MSHSLAIHNYPLGDASKSRATSVGLISDGVTGNRGQMQTPGARGAVNGAAALTWRGVLTVPTSNTASFAYICFIGLSVNPDTGGWTNSSAMWAMLFSSILYIETADGSTNRRSLTFGAFRTTYSGQTGVLEIAFVAGTSNPVVRWNDVDISASFLVTGSTNWIDASLTPTIHLTGHNWPSGPAPLGCWILGSLTDSNRTYWRTTGRPPLWVQLGGTALQVISGDSATFAGGIGSWYTTGGTITHDLANQAADITTGVGSTNGVALDVPNFRNGSRIRLEVDVLAFSGAPVVRLSRTDGGDAAVVFIINSVGTISAEGFASTAFTTSRLFFSAGVGTVKLGAIRLYSLGALSLPLPQPGNIIADGTSLADNPAYTVGMTNNTDAKTGQYTTTLSWAGTHEAKLINLGANLALVSGYFRITDITTKATVASSGSGLTIGSVVSPGNYVSLNTYTTAKKVHTLVGTLPSDIANNQTNLVLDPDTANYTGSITVTVRYQILHA